MDPHVVIAGGGFGGLHAARAFRGAPVRVTLLDRKNHHVFQPLLYQVATAALSPGDIASPIRWIRRHQPNVEVQPAELRSVDAARRTVILTDGAMSYDQWAWAYFSSQRAIRLITGSDSEPRA